MIKENGAIVVAVLLAYFCVSTLSPARLLAEDADPKPAREHSTLNGHDQKGELVRVMSFNIRYGTASDGENHWNNRKDLVVDVLQDHAPDVVGMQEALRFQLDYIREHVPHYREVGVGRDDGLESGEYSPILYDARRFYAGTKGTFWLSRTPDIPGSRHWGNTIPRICSWARLIDRRSGTAFYLYNVHMDHISQPSREKGMALIVQRMAKRAHPDPVILTGDMNARPDNPAIGYLLGRNRDQQNGNTCDPILPTFVDTYLRLHPEGTNDATFNGWRGWREGNRIDYIFVMQQEPPVRILEAEIIRDNQDGRYPSDHYPVEALVAFPEQ
jgi:endonuclease/exonuclease/phosphatase family metal-dependent hydrolase